jgi:hypothetical protein
MSTDTAIKGVGGSGLELITSTSQALDVNLKGSTSGGSVPITPTRGTLTDRSAAIAAGGVAQTVAAANSSRKYFLFENVSDTNMWLNFTTTATAAQPSLLIVPNGSLVMEDGFVSTELVSVICATTAKQFTAKEG